MKPSDNTRTWLIAALLAVFLSACATTQEEILDESAAADAGQMQTDGGSMTDDSTSGGASTSGIAGGDDASVSAIGDDSAMSMSAVERLEQTEGHLANRTIYFEYDSASLTDESIAILETHGNFIAGNGEVTVRLEGHADERGSREYNIALGDRRAQSVRRVLLFQGASTDQVDTVSYGEEQPVDLGHTEEAWAKNRRVELIYTVN
jgi:peptidoglycan-associated lipoprotein